MNCKLCEGKCQKAGKQKDGSQKYFCRQFKKYQQSTYRYNAYKPKIEYKILTLHRNGLGIRAIARVLRIAINTVLACIQKLAKNTTRPPIPFNRRSVEIDEISTYVGRKENQFWVAYAFCTDTKQVLDFIVCKRNKRSLRLLVENIVLSKPKVIKTDKLSIYQGLIPRKLHDSRLYSTNGIERNNLTIRTHLKRLNRRTICFSRSLEMLNASLKLYFWNQPFQPLKSNNI
jgi:insertion element IS1 protein InsB